MNPLAFRSRRGAMAAAIMGLAGVGSAFGRVSLPEIFSDGLVLQRDQPVRIWGKADPGEHIEVHLGADAAQTIAQPDGSWTAFLPERPADLVTATLTVKGDHDERTVKNVLRGDVWLCSGQSNMEFVVDAGPGATFRVQNAEAEEAQANHPLIRQFTVARKESDAPRTEAAGSWAVCTPETVKKFTAAGYFFARDLQATLHVPIGLVYSTWGGTPIEAWTGAPALAQDPAFAVVAQRWQHTLQVYPTAKAKYEAALAAWKQDPAKARPRAPQGPGTQDTPSGLYNAMIHPLIGVRFRGALWYQGEANAGRSAEYGALFRAMISEWRQDFGQPDLPFYFVQLAAFGKNSSDAWPRQRDAQASALQLPHTGMAVAIDIGDPGNIHPRNKQEVGRRLALIAENQVYGRDVPFQGPTFTGAASEGGAMRVTFAHADGLKAKGPQLEGFQVAGADRVFHDATATIDGSAVVVKSDAVASPAAVRYGWLASPTVNLYNAADLPAVPFRSDTW